MKKNLVCLLSAFLMCLSSVGLYAQTEIDSSFQIAVNHVFVNLDKSKVPYGILRDYAMEFTNLENFGEAAVQADSNYCDPGAFAEVYRTLLTGRIHPSASGLLRQDTIGNRWMRYRQPGRITLSGLYFSYSRFRDDAANNYVTITNDQLYDKYIDGVWQNPYQTETAFVISPPITRYSEVAFNILLPQDLWLTNNSAAISAISIDVGDGAGYRTLTPGVDLPVNYTNSGTYEWKYRITLVAGGYHHAHSLVTIGVISSATN
jgi:hypothetical protein